MHVDRTPPHSDTSGPAMATPALSPSPDAAPALTVAVVTAAPGGGAWTVEAAGRALAAGRAVSCLVEPAVGDTVLLLADSPVGQRILAVLDRSAAAPVTLTGGEGRDVTLAAPAVTIAASRRAAVQAPDAEVTASRLAVRADSASLVGRLVEATADTLKTVALSVMSVAERVTASAGTSTRMIQGADTVQARDLVYQAGETALVRGARTSVSAVDDVVITGSRISMT